MITSKKVYGKAMAMPAGIGIGTAISLIALLAGSAVLAMLLDREAMQEEVLGYGIMAVLLISSAAGATVSARLIKRRQLLVGATQAVCFYGCLLLINGLAFGGTISGTLVTALLILGGAGCGCLLCGAGQKKRTGFKIKRTG